MGSSLRPVGGELWHCTMPFKLLGAEFGARMTVVKLPSQKLFIHSPIALDERLKKNIVALGEVAILVAPNCFHHLFLKQWQDAFPEAKTFVAPGLPEKLKGLKHDGIIERHKKMPWESTLKHDLVNGMPKMNEVVFFHPASRTLIATDLLFNLDSSSASMWSRWLYKLFGFGNGPGVSKFFLKLLKDRDAFGKSIGRIVLWDFERLSIAHGATIESGAREKLEDIFREYLRRPSSIPPAKPGSMSPPAQKKTG